MKYPQQSLIIIGLVVVTLLSGCAGKEAKDTAPKAKTAGTVADNATTMKAEGTETDDATTTKVEGTVAGGLATRVLGKVVPGGKNIKRITRYGSALGGVGGYLLGSTIAERKKKYVNEEDRLNGEIKIFNKLNTKLSTYNTATVKEIASLQKQLSEIEGKKQVTREQAAFSAKAKESYSKKIALDKATTAKLAAELSDLNEYFKSIQGDGNPSRVAALRKEIEILQKQTAQFESNNKQMDQIVATMPVRN